VGCVAQEMELDSRLSAVRANSFDYLTELQRHAQDVETKQAEWLPWNQRETLERTIPLSDSA
jgi:hypothetical protein